jgi:hypothetical protein
MKRTSLIRPWLAEDDTALLQYAAQGLPPRMIATKVRRTSRAVQHRIAALRRKERAKGAAGAERRSSGPADLVPPITVGQVAAGLEDRFD